MPHIFASLIKNTRDRRPQAAPKPISESMAGAVGPLTSESDLTSEGRQDAPRAAYRHALGSRVVGMLRPWRHAEARARRPEQ